MAKASSSSSLSILRLLTGPALITLGIMILRLAGEMRHWSTLQFNNSAGGGAAIIGVAWLPFIFVKYFLLGLVPQLVFWVAYTVVLGSLCGSIAAAIKGRGKAAVPAA